MIGVFLYLKRPNRRNMIASIVDFLSPIILLIVGAVLVIVSGVALWILSTENKKKGER